MVELHKIQVAVMRELWFHKSCRFSEMMAVTDLTSDDFKFHLRKLVKIGLVEKNSEGSYQLTQQGKEFANRFEYEAGKPIYQPKLTTVTYVYRNNPDTQQKEFLFHQRQRQPFYEYWGVIGRPVRLGETFEEAATLGLKEQTGLEASLSMKGFYRQRDVLNDSEEILEDKLFVVFTSEWQGDEPQHWPHAAGKWMTIDEVDAQPKRFDSCVDMLRRLDESQIWFADNETSYNENEF